MVTTPINHELLKSRRDTLQRLVGNDTAIIMSTAAEQPRNGDVCFAFRPNSDFYYLSHFPEPQAVAVLLPRPRMRFVLFCLDSDTDAALWSGERIGVQGALRHYGADEAFPISAIDKVLPALLKDYHQVGYKIGCDNAFDQRVNAWLKASNPKRWFRRATLPTGIDIGGHLNEMRLIKDDSEIKLMEQAAVVSADAHKRAMRVCRSGMYEYQIAAELEYAFKHSGNHSAAYPSIVASGANGCTLHYTANRSRLNDGGLLLIDAAAEVDCYASDITRTFPVNGHFSPYQKILYELVLTAQLKAIAACVVGNNYNDPHQAAVKVLCQGLLDIGLLGGSLDQALESKSWKRFYMHRTSHWLGLDVHDVGSYKVDDNWRELKPGMVLTVEPALYIGNDDDIAQYWHNTAIRIEDVVLVTDDTPRVLTASAPKQIDEIQALMADAGATNGQ